MRERTGRLDDNLDNDEEGRPAEHGAPASPDTAGLSRSLETPETEPGDDEC
jgi:hypothetical protein